MLKLILIILNH